MTEIIVNGGFETGDLTGWDYSQAFATDQYAHTGTYSVFLYQGWIEQILSSMIPKSQINSFGFWAMGQAINSCIVTFSDDSELFVEIPSGMYWQYVDILPLIPDGKTVKKVRFQGWTGGPSWVDDVSLDYTYEPPPPAPESDMTIEDSYRSLNIWHVIRINQNQDCASAIRPVPRRQESEIVDIGTWIMTTMTLEITSRLSDAERTTLEQIFDDEAEITITLISGWAFKGWFRNKNINFEYCVTDNPEGGTILRNWRVDMTFDIYLISYTPP